MPTEEVLPRRHRHSNGHERSGIAIIQWEGVGVATTRRQEVQGIWDIPCDEDLGGGPRVFQRQITAVSMVNDDSERVIGPESGQGVHANEGEVDDGQAKGLSAGPGQ